MSTNQSRQVAIIYPFFPHYREPILRELSERGRHKYLLVGDVAHVGGDIEPANVELWENFVRAPCWLLFGRILMQKGLVKIALDPAIDTVIYHGGTRWPSMWLLALLCRLKRKRLINWTHGWTRADRGVARWSKYCLFRFLGDALLLYGHYAKQIGISQGISPERMHVVYNSLDVEKQNSIRERVDSRELAALKSSMFSHPERPVVICSSRLVDAKRLDLLLLALARLENVGCNINLILVGDGPARSSLEEMAERLGLNVHFVGACYDEELLARLTMAACVTVAPGNIGLTAMQSLVYGTPVITHEDVDHQMPEVEAVVPGKTGGLFRRNNVESLMEQIKSWVNGPIDDAAVQQACRDVITRFYNPGFQRLVIERAIDGEPANDLFWLENRTLQNVVEVTSDREAAGKDKQVSCAE